MECSRCKHENRVAAKFCEECGAGLGHGCPNCGNLVPIQILLCTACAHPIEAAPQVQATSRFISPQNYTPEHLAKRIIASRSALEGERKQITVLFADIKGSMELIADRDPEEARKILNPVLDRMMEAVHRYEGTVNHVMGDGIMALFGAPIAHEDHAVRACYASLRMQELMAQYTDEVQRLYGVPATIRVGLNSGEIVVSCIGSDLRMDYIVVGHTVHLAARMEQMARPGSVLITANTLRLAEGYVTARPLGLTSVKGLADLLQVYEVIGGGPARTRLQAAVRRGLTRFVGRDSEIDQLYQALERTCIGQGQVVAVIGQPGVGKSRLVHEFIHSPRAAGCLVLESNSVSYGRATPYLPVIELLRNYFKITVQDRTRSIREKVMSKTLKMEPSLRDAIPPILDLLDALCDDHPFHSVDPLQHRQHTYRSIVNLLLSESRAQPVVALFEDLHWSDSLTLGLLDEVAIGAKDAHLLLVVSYRPEHRDEWRNLPNYLSIHLDPLASNSVAKLLRDLLGSDPALSALNSLVLERAGGIPFFVEEIVRTLVDTGILDGIRGSHRLTRPLSSIEVPATVQAVLGARIDALPAAEKRLLQEAAVIGHNVAYALLHGISGLAEDDLRGLLSNLQVAEFLYTTQLFPDLEYAFKHSLTHDVAYAGLLHERRCHIHAHIVDIMEGLYAERLGEQVERLADHAWRGQRWEKAVNFLRQSGVKAADRVAYREAVSLFEKALGALAHLPESSDTFGQAIDIRFDMRNALQPLGDHERIAQYLQEAKLLATRLNDARRMGWVQSYLTDHFWMRGRYGDAAVAGEQALVIAEQTCDLSLQVVTNLPLGLAYHTQGDYHRAIEYFRWNAARLDGEHAQERFGMFVLPSSFSLSFMAWAFADLGDFVEGSAVGRNALQIAETAEHPFSCGYAHLGLGVLALRQGDLHGAIQSFEQALGANGFADSPVGFAFVAFHLGYARALAGRSDDGILMLEQTVRLAESKGFVARHALRLAYLSEAYLIADRSGEAAAAGLCALELAREHDERANQAYALRILGEVELHCGRPAEAEDRFHTALRLSEALGMRPLQVHCHRGMAVVLEARRQAPTAIAHRKTATALADTIGMHLGD